MPSNPILRYTLILYYLLLLGFLSGLFPLGFLNRNLHAFLTSFIRMCHMHPF
jgi:hypothetical protein